MPTRYAPVAEERRALPMALWALGGLGLLTLTALGTAQGLGDVTIAAIPAALVGVLVLVRPEFGVMALTTTFFLSYPKALERLGPFTINTLLFAVLGCILFARFVLYRRLDVLKSRQVQVFGLLVLAMCVNVLLVDRALPPGRVAPAPWEGAPLQSLPAFLDQSAQRFQNGYMNGLYLLFFVAFIRKRWQILSLAALFVSFVLITSPNASWNAITSVGTGDETRAAATFGILAARNSNRLAFLCIAAIAFIGYAMTAYRSLATTFFGGTAIVLLVVTIFLSASRSGFVNLGILSLIFLTRTGIKPGRIIALACILLVTVVMVHTFVPESHLNRITNILASERTEEGGGSSIARRQMLDLGLQMFADHPLLGIGIGNAMWTAIVDYGGVRQSALHNSYLNALVEGGLLLFASYALLFWSTFASLRRTARLAVNRPDVGLEWLVGATRTSFLLMLVFSAFADVWFEVPLILLIGLSAVLENQYREQPAGRTAPTAAMVTA